MKYSNRRDFRSKQIVIAVLIYIVTFLFAVADGKAQTMQSRTRIGGYSEDITFVASGPLKDNIIILDGYEVFAVKNAKKPTGSLTRLFDVKIPEIDTVPNGITYIESEGLFALNNVTQPTKLFLFDNAGIFKGTRTIQYPGGFVPQHMEGMAYIPASSPMFPDHLIVTALDTLNGPSHIEVVRRDGLVVAEVPIPPSDGGFDTTFIGDVAFLAPNKLLITFYDNTIRTIDFAGNVLAGPQVVTGTSGFEGIVQMSDNRIVAVGFPQSLLFFEKNLVRAPESDRNDLIGLNLNTPNGVAWNSDTNQLMIQHDVPNFDGGIAAVPVSLDSASPVANLSPFFNTRSLSYLPDDHLIAVLRINNSMNRAILLFNNNGTLNSQVSLSPASLGEDPGPPLALTYIPATQEFVVSFGGFGGGPSQAEERRRLRVISRTGVPVRTIDLTSTGTGGVAGLAYFDDPGGGGGRFIILGSAGRAFVTDLDGNSRNSNGFLIREFNVRAKFGLRNPADITAITTGPQAGAFCAIDNRDGETVIFRLD